MGGACGEHSGNEGLSLPLAFVKSVGITDSKAINNSPGLFSLIATDTSEWRSFQCLRFMACREWSFEVTLPAPCPVSCKGGRRAVCPLSWSSWKGQRSLFGLRAARAASIAEKVSALYCRVICLVSTKSSSNIILRLLTMKSIQLKRSPHSFSQRKCCPWNHLLDKVTLLPIMHCLVSWVKWPYQEENTDNYKKTQIRKFRQRDLQLLLHLFTSHCLWKWGPWVALLKWCRRPEFLRWKSVIRKHSLSSPRFPCLLGYFSYNSQVQ